MAKVENMGIIIDGNEIQAMSEDELAIFRRRNLGIVYQFYNLIPTLTAEANIALPWKLDGRLSLIHIFSQSQCVLPLQISHAAVSHKREAYYPQQNCRLPPIFCQESAALPKVSLYYSQK